MDKFIISLIFAFIFGFPLCLYSAKESIDRQYLQFEEKCKRSGGVVAQYKVGKFSDYSCVKKDSIIEVE